MRRFVLLVGVLAVGSGCEKAKKEKLYDGPMPVTFGDCAGPNTAWLSGPRPAAFELSTAMDVGTTVASADPTTLKPQDDPPPPEEDPPPPEDGDDESGGTGTAMALDEGKMGKKDSDRQQGQYKMKNAGDDPQLARQQAIEQARANGILGSTALVQGGAFASLTGTGDISSGYDDTNIYGGLLGNEAGEMNGGYGFGRSGFGPGGGGTGWGTIGTGKYGTIGYGSGTGAGYGVGGGRGGMRGRAANVPTVSIGQPNAQGDLDKAIIRRYIKRNIQKITYCYEKELLAKPGIAGTVMTQFFISPNGEVVNATGNGMDKNVADCVAAVIKGIVFPKPKGGGGVQVNYPFTFRPADAVANTTTSDPNAGSATDPNAGSADPNAGSADPNAGSGSAQAPAAGGGSAAKPSLGVGDGTYQPGAANPLRGAEAELEKCFRKGKVPYGIAVFDLAYEAGKVSKTDVHGIDDANVKTCVLAVAKKLKVAGAIKAERCSVAYGKMPVSAAPSLDVKADVVSLKGMSHGTIDSLMREQNPSFKIASLYEALDARVKSAMAPTSAVVTLHGPLVIKAIDAAKMKIVNRVLISAIAAGDDFVLAYQAGPDWELLSHTPIALPVVPVPYGTGDMWRQLKGKTRDLAMIMAEDEHVTLSVLVMADKTWVGLSRVNEFRELPGRDLAKLAAVLAEHKKSAFFADRVDIEVAGDADAAYVDVINAIKTARDAGFTNWRITDPNGLAARPQL